MADQALSHAARPAPATMVRSTRPMRRAWLLALVGLAADSSLLTDLGAVIAHTRVSNPGPLVLLGHSMGGLVVGRYVAEGLAPQPAAWWQPVDALVMSSPALDPGMNALQKLLLSAARPPRAPPDRPWPRWS